MLYNYLKITFRNLLKHRGYSFINIFGLAAGISCTLLICLYIAHELSYDRWNPNANRILRTYAEINFGGNFLRLAVTGTPIGPDVAQEIPEVKSYCRFRDYGSYLVKKDGEGQQNFKEENVLTVDSTFFELFPRPLLAGDARTCLAEPNTLAISASRAEKYFGSPQQAIGQTLVFDNKDRRKVTAVFEDFPSNTHFRVDLLLAMNGNQEVLQSPPLWAMSNNFHTYILLREDAEKAVFAEKFKALSRKKTDETGRQLLGMSLEEFEATGQFVRFGLQNLTDIHLHSDLGVELAPNGSVQYVWIFGAIALFVLLIACINFMNLSTARSAHRAREIGIRKVLGSDRGALIFQFLTETVLMSAIAIVLALAFVTALLPWFGELTGRQLAMPWGEPLFWVAIAGGMVLTGLLAGSYPAFFLSAFDPVRVLKGKLAGKAGGAGLRSGLVVFQFATSILLIIATMLVYKQLNFIQNKKLGFSKDQVIVLNDAWTLGDQVETFRQEMLTHPAVEAASVSSYLPIPSSRSNTTFTTTREFRQDNAINMGNWTMDYDYLKTLQLEMAVGRFFDRNFPTDSSAVILNETAARILGFDNPLDKKIYTFPEVGPDADLSPDRFVELTIIGVVKDFHWESLRENIGPLCLLLGKADGSISFRYKAGETKTVLTALQSGWGKMAPGQPFSYRFLDEEFGRMYESEQKTGSIAAGFALLSALISCLGLFGLASFMAEQRTKEIGVRKVLGATAGSIVGLLSKDFLKLVLIAFFIACPLAWYFMKKWLQDFAYHIDLGIWVFVMAGILAMAVAFLTVFYQSMKAALADPVRSLRSE